MKRISNYTVPALTKTRVTERGELLKYFAQKTDKKIPFIAFKLTGFKLSDLYYLKSLCDGEERRGEPWAKVFFGSIKSKPQ